jgi:hypothetical protein
MIISASYRTDIPAFYGEWFMTRLDAGYCLVANPYSNQPYRVSLRREDVDGFIFWTKNLGPFMNYLTQIRKRGYPFIIQYTITGYPRALEFSVVDAQRAIEHMKVVAGTYGPRTAVWRYDTIVFSSLTPPDFHRRNFERLARALQATTDEVVISFAQIYQKTRRNMNWAARHFGFTWEDPPDVVKCTLCGQRQFLTPGIADARCIDAWRLADVAGTPIATGSKGHRRGCGCHASRDIGAYDTCPHGCVYCYAVQRRTLAQRRYRAHNPDDQFLYAPSNIGVHD